MLQNIEVLRIYCELQIELLEKCLEKKLISNGKRRYLMGEISGIEKILMRIEKMENGEVNGNTKRKEYIKSISNFETDD